MKYKRLKKNADFQRLFKKGKKVYSPHLTVIYTPCKGQCVMGVALSKKHGKAVRRNRIKRLVRAAFSHSVDSLKGSYSLVILPKVEEKYSYGEIARSLSICLKKMEG